MDWTFSKTPLPHGIIHWLILGCILAAAVIFALAIRRTDERRLLRLLFVFGLCMLAAEAWKQWFVIRYIDRGTRSMWFFPWQLCSMAMYCSALAPFLKGRAQDAVLVFLCTFSVIGAVFALLFPEYMMRPHILLFVHSFLYHTVMLFEGLIAKVASLQPLHLLQAGFLGLAELSERQLGNDQQRLNTGIVEG